MSVIVVAEQWSHGEIRAGDRAVGGAPIFSVEGAHLIREAFAPVENSAIWRLGDGEHWPGVADGNGDIRDSLVSEQISDGELRLIVADIRVSEAGSGGG